MGRGGAWEDKGRIYQPQPFFNFIIGTQPLLQPLLDFLRLTITVQPWGVGWAGVGLGKIRVGSTSHNLLQLHYRDTTATTTATRLPSTYHHTSTLGGGVGWGGAREDKGRIYQPQPFFNFTIGTQPLLQPLLDFLRLTITLQPWGVGWAGVGLGKIRVGSTSHNLSSTSL